MPKLVFVLNLREDKSREEGLRYWKEVHGPIAAKTPGLRKYVQNHISSRRGVNFDGVAELWWDSHETMQRAMASPEWQATMADAPNFADMTKSTGTVVDEISVV